MLAVIHEERFRTGYSSAPMLTRKQKTIDHTGHTLDCWHRPYSRHHAVLRLAYRSRWSIEFGT